MCSQFYRPALVWSGRSKSAAWQLCCLLANVHLVVALKRGAFDGLPEPGMMAAPHRHLIGRKSLSGGLLNFLITHGPERRLEVQRADWHMRLVNWIGEGLQ